MFIEFGIVNSKLLILLLYPIFYQISFFVTQNNTSPLYDIFMSSLSYSPAGLIYLIVLYRSNIIKKSTPLKNSTGKLVAVNQIYIENRRIEKKHKIKKMISIFLLSFIFPIPLFIESCADKLINISFISSFGIISYILYNILFSHFF